MLQQKQGSWCGCTQPMRDSVSMQCRLIGWAHPQNDPCRKLLRWKLTCWQATYASLHRTPEGLGTDFRPKNGKLAVTLELVGKVVCSSYVTHQKVISYCWVLTITWAYSPLKLTISMTAFNRQKRSWNLSVSLASDSTRSWILLRSQVFADWS